MIYFTYIYYQEYNKHMGGVDRADQKLSLYQADRKGLR